MFPKKKFVTVALLAVFTIYQNTARAQHTMRVTDTFYLSGDGRFDYLIVGKQKLYASHSDKVNIVDIKTGKELGTINGLSGVHGIALDYADGKGFISNGTGNNVSVFDLKTNAVTGTIKTEKNPDAIIFEPFTKTIIVGNGKSKSLSVIDPKTETCTHTIDLGGKPEASVSDNEGNLFVNIEDKSEIAVVDLKTYTIKKRIALLPEGEDPAGLAIERKNKLLFAGCRNKKLVIVNYENGKIIKTYPIGGYSDGVAYNPDTKTIFSSNGDGTLTILKQMAPDILKVSTVPTQIGAKTIAIDVKTNSIYLSTAKFGTEKDTNGKPVVLPNTFRILVVK